MRRSAALVLTLLAMSACGGPTTEPPADDDSWMDGIPGAYEMDARRTLGKTVPGPDGKPIELSDEKLAEIQAAHGGNAMRLILEEGGTFELVTGFGEQVFKTAGTWKETPTGFSMVTTTVNGEPAPEEVSAVVEQYETERGYVIGVQGTQRVYLKKMKPRPK